MSELMGDEMLFSLGFDQFLSKPLGLDWLSKDQQFVPVPLVFLDDGRFAFKSDDGQICLVDGVQGLNEENCQNLAPCLDDPTELPPLSDATIKSLLVQGNLGLDGELGFAAPDMPTIPLEDRDLSEVIVPEMALSEVVVPEMALSEVVVPEMALSEVVVPEMLQDSLPADSIMDPTLGVDDDLNTLVSFRCQFCSFSSANVPSLMEHSRTQHEQPEHGDEETVDSVEDIENSLSQVPSEDQSSEFKEDSAEQIVYFLCSECKEGFTSVTQCRDHMIIDHKMVLDEEREKEIEAETVLIEDEDVEKLEDVEKVEEVKKKEEKKEDPPEKVSPPSTPKPPALKDLLAARLPKPRTKKDWDPEYEAKPHKCPEPMCFRRFSKKSCLRMHHQCHTQGGFNERSFCCFKCSEVFFKWGQCAFHLWKEHKIDIDLFTCNVCGEYKTTTRRKLDSHRKIHSDERPYKCKVCDKGFKQPTQLINHTSSVHKKQHEESASKWYMAQKCEICLKTYADSKCLKKHMQAVHSKLKPYKCQICGHMSARKAMLQVHIRQHTGEKPFACSICSFRTGDHNSLRRHVMRHTGDKPYKCPHCSYSSIQSSSFKAHLQSKHPGQGGSYSCRQCHWTTISEQQYRKHLSDHRLNLIPLNDNEVFPENMAAASLVFHSFGASRCDITASATSRDGMKQTITISIPQADADGTASDDEDTTHCFLPDTGGITIPAEPEPDNDQSLMCFS